METVSQETLRRGSDFLAAIERYRDHPYRRDLPEGEILWQQGSTSVKHFPAASDKAPGLPLLLVPSLVNRAYIFDLMEDQSFLRAMRNIGHPVYLVDWSAPAEEEREFGLDQYIADRLVSGLGVANRHAGTPPVAVGYCMGGLLTLALARLQGEALSGLVLLATPWDFHHDQPQRAQSLATAGLALEPMMEAKGCLPADLIQCLFTALDPLLVLRKFLAFYAMAPDSDEATAFVALEDWLNDGVDLVAPTARQCLAHWYGDNQTARKAWQVDGEVIDPEAIGLPTLCIVPRRDRIVPPASAEPLGSALPHCDVMQPAVGHIGMMASRQAARLVWQPVAQWLKELAQG